MRDGAAIASLPRLEWDAGRAATPAWRVGLIWLLCASSSIVLVEPAPYDLLAIGTLAAFLLTGLRLPRQLAVPLLLLTLFLVGNWLAAATSSDPVATLRSLGIRTYLCGTFLLFAGAVALAPHRMLRVIWAGYAVAATIAAAWGALQYFGYVATPDGWFRAQGPFKDPNVFGPFLVPVALWCMELVSDRRGWARSVGLALLVATLFGVLLSFSRGAWLNLFGAAVTYFALRFFATRSGRSRLRMVGTSLTVLALSVGLLSVAAISERFSGQFAERARLFQDYDVASTGRFAAQARAVESATTNPLGIGPGRSDDEFGLEPHNLYLHVITEGGWIAGLAFWSFLALTLARSLPLLRRPWSFGRETQIVFAAIAGILLQSFFIDSTHWRHLYLLLGMLWALILVHAQQPTDHPP